MATARGLRTASDPGIPERWASLRGVLRRVPGTLTEDHTMGQRRGSTRAAAAATLIALLTLVAGCTGGSSPQAGARRPHDHRPNIVFVLTDDLSSNLIKYMPHVQALMDRGVSFSNFFVVDSLCCPSRAATFTGRYPHDDGVYTNSGPDGGYQAYNKYGNPPRSFAVPLHESGYRTAFMGKYLNGYTARDPVPPGWDDWFGVHDGYAEYNYRLNDNGHVESYGSDPGDYLTDVLSAKATQFIDDSAGSGSPFALEVATFAPHAPFVAAPLDRGTFPGLTAPRTPDFNRQSSNAPAWLANLPPLSTEDIQTIDNKFERRVEQVQAVDRMVGQLERELVGKREMHNTYFVFSSDNGFHMGEHGLEPGKQTAFDTDIRVPLVVSGPGLQAGQTISAMASNVDLGPTFLDIAGTKPSAEPDGVSLLNLLRGVPAPRTWQRAVLVEHHGPVAEPSDPDVQPPDAGAPPSYEAIRTRSELYVEYVTGEREYYNLNSDPDELHNVVGTLSKAQLERLHEQLVGLENCHGATQCQRAATASSLPAG
jgi:N-acetylglucosamine-6-sulfatase